MPGIAVKICGLTTPDAVVEAARGGADYVGFVFFPPSPRWLSAAAAAALAEGVPAATRRVGLVVDADDALLETILANVPLDMLQLHGNEPPARVAAIRQRFGLPVIKAIGVADTADVRQVPAYEDVADWLLFDARPPVGSSLPGGNARAFDWALLRGVRCARPWFLAGGLDADNVAAAVDASGAQAVDVSSGVEERPGVKSIAKIARFLRVAAAIAPADGGMPASDAGPAGTNTRAAVQAAGSRAERT